MPSSNRYRRGYYVELKLKRLLESRGFWATRIPRSGSSKPVLDVVAIKNGLILGFECKRRKSRIYSKEIDFESLEIWEKLTGGRAFVCVYFDQEPGLRFFPWREAKKMDKIDVKTLGYMDFRSLMNMLFSRELL
jgi:Holliday junction resolvase